MEYRINFKNNVINAITYSILSLLALVLLQSCEDIIDCESYYEKDLLLKALSSSDSLSFLDIREIDFGSVKTRSVNNMFASIYNSSENDIITIYSIKATNQTGLFQVLDTILPFQILPEEDIALTKRIRIKFIADAFNPGYHYDTLIINDNKDFYIPVKAKVRY